MVAQLKLLTTPASFEVFGEALATQLATMKLKQFKLRANSCERPHVYPLLGKPNVCFQGSFKSLCAATKKRKLHVNVLITIKFRKKKLFFFLF